MAVDRLSLNDVTELATETRSSPRQVAIVLRFEAPLPEATVVRSLSDGVVHVPALRRRLQRVPFGLGRPVWVDDAAFDIANHVRRTVVAEPDEENTVLDVAASACVDPLARERPLWAATLVTDTAGGCHALILVVHHVVTDGIGGLAALADLLGGGTAPQGAFPRPAPSRRELFHDVTARRLRALRHSPAALGRLWSGLLELRGARSDRPPGSRRHASAARDPRSTLSRPIGPRRRLLTARCDLTDAATAAHRHGASVNELLLAAVAGALAATVHGRGEHADGFVISVPVSGRTGTEDGALGNEVGVQPVYVPAVGRATTRLDAIAGSTRRRRRPTGQGASAALLGAAFRMLARVGLFAWFVDRQRMVHTFVTNLRGPAEPLVLNGVRISDLIAVSPIAGNVAVAFAALSYCGRLTVTVIADPGAYPDLSVLGHALQRELDGLVHPR